MRCSNAHAQHTRRSSKYLVWRTEDSVLVAPASTRGSRNTDRPRNAEVKLVDLNFISWEACDVFIFKLEIFAVAREVWVKEKL